jgi:chromosome segregation ATPase
MQAQIKELQAKYQEQRQKWERLLSDLRTRNDELHRQNQALEEEMAALRERQRLLIMEISNQRAAPPSAAEPSPEVAAPTAAEPRFQPPINEPFVQAPPSPEISIETPSQTSGGFSGGPPEAAFEIPLAQPEPQPAGEADDLLAELDALEREMKNLGGEGQG